jgi:hypothetical protein
MKLLLALAMLAALAVPASAGCQPRSHMVCTFTGNGTPTNCHMEFDGDACSTVVCDAAGHNCHHVQD